MYPVETDRYFPVILTAQKTGETGGVKHTNCAYTYYCAEDLTSKGPAAEGAPHVEPGVRTAVRYTSLLCHLSAGEARR